MRDDEAVEGMEAALIRVTEIVRRKDSELEALRRTVERECDERVRLLGRVQQLEGAAAAPPPPAPVVYAEPEMYSTKPAPPKQAPKLSGTLSGLTDASRSATNPAASYAQLGRARQTGSRGRGRRPSV